MQPFVVRYKVKPESIGENRQLVEALYAELREHNDQHVRFLTLLVGDGTFVHVSIVDEGAPGVSDLRAFATYHEKLGERVVEGPIAGEATIVGDYRVLGERTVTARR